MVGIIVGAIASIAAAATTVVKALTVVGLAVEGLKTIGKVLMSLGKALGLIKPEIEVDELGDKAIQSEYNPEDYDSYAEYVKAVEDYELDPEKSKQISEEEKIKKGMELVTGITIEKYQELPMDKLCIMVGENPNFFTESKMKEIAKLIETDQKQIPNILNFMDGTEKDDIKLQDAFQTLMTIEKTADPSLSDKEAMKNVLEARK